VDRTTLYRLLEKHAISTDAATLSAANADQMGSADAPIDLARLAD